MSKKKNEHGEAKPQPENEPQAQPEQQAQAEQAQTEQPQAEQPQTEQAAPAQEKPQDYQTLIVRIAGFSAYFVDMTTEMQNDIISREEHRV